MRRKPCPPRRPELPVAAGGRDALIEKEQGRGQLIKGAVGGDVDAARGGAQKEGRAMGGAPVHGHVPAVDVEGRAALRRGGGVRDDLPGGDRGRPDVPVRATAVWDPARPGLQLPRRVAADNPVIGRLPRLPDREDPLGHAEAQEGPPVATEGDARKRQREAVVGARLEQVGSSA